MWVCCATRSPHLWVWIMGQVKVCPREELGHPAQARKEGELCYPVFFRDSKARVPYFQLGTAGTAGCWSFSPASSRGVCLQRLSSGSGERVRVSQASTLAPSSHKTAWKRAAAAPQPGRRTSLPISLCWIPKASPFISPHGFCTSLLGGAGCAALRGAGTSREVDSHGLPQQQPHPQGGTPWPAAGLGQRLGVVKGHTGTAHGFLLCSCFSELQKKLQSN